MRRTEAGTDRRKGLEAAELATMVAWEVRRVDTLSSLPPRVTVRRHKRSREVTRKWLDEPGIHHSLS